MSLFRRAKGLLIGAALLLALSLVLRMSVRSPEKQTLLDRAVVRLLAPLQGLSAGLLGRISSLWTGYVALVGVQQENLALKKQNAELRSQLTSVSALAMRAQRLERLLDLRAQVLADTAVAQVISVETSRQFRVVRVRIDRGGVEVKPGMPVIAAEGVVGRIARSVGPYADVQLLTDARSAIDVVLPRSESRGVMKGTGSDSRYVSRIEYVLKKESIEVGADVLSSGLGGSFPRDLPVGKVTAVRKSDASLYQEIEVEPSVSFAHLREVLIVLSPPPPPDPDAGKRGFEAARGPGVPR
ncbi:MAG TPA: rod shape-determining protein MreC [Pseudomonadota bacterium]|nr:rod shape-determining protein MreC [Pseudomonadota bacterium]HNK43249.1 rod shape-determining protein MreC [Pseudomonadota bacterium]